MQLCDANASRVKSIGVQGGPCDVTERNGLGRLDGHTSSEGTDLFMDVQQESLGAPATLLLNCCWSNAIEMHGHGPTCAEGVAADVIASAAQVVRADEVGCVLESLADVICIDRFPGGRRWIFAVKDVSALISSTGDDMVDWTG